MLRRKGWTIAYSDLTGAGNPVIIDGIAGSGIYSFFNATGYMDSTAITSLTASAAPSGTARGDGRIFRLSTTENIFSVAAGGTVATDEGSGNTSFPRCIKAIWTSTQRMLALDATHGLYYSNVLDAQAWNRTTNLLTLASPRDGNNVDLLEYRPGQVLIAVEDALLQLDISNPNPSFWQLRTLVVGLKFMTTSRHALTPCGRDVMLMAKQGVFSLLEIMSTSRGLPKPISYPLNITISTSSRHDLFAIGHRVFLYSDQTYKTYSGNGITLSIRAFEYDAEQNRWCALAGTTDSLWARVVTDMAEFNGVPYGVTTGGNDIFLESGARDSDGDSALLFVPYIFETKAFTGGDLKVLKIGEFLEVTFLGDTGDVPTLEYMTDESGTWTAFTDSLSLSGTTGKTLKIKIPLGGIDEWYSIKFRWQTIDDDPGTSNSKILSIAVFFRINNQVLSGG